MKFTYRSGERPLDGYTLKRGVGRGGFGEVYFGLSDGGKEVALKLLKGPTEIEQRGVASCLNLKHPNLVHIYDLRTDARGDLWLVMEYVLGESMAQVIQRHPQGLPVPLAAEWFGSVARAVGFLHDHGVVHRDLKPANVFVENGTLKVGDYGLCKALGASRRDQTRQVGTVHYMAPEISTGNYNRQIDVYSCGVILHEMLTGDVPFTGESDGEILMKHLTAEPDLGKVPAAFRPLIAAALSKNPLDRPRSMAEFARAVESAAQSVAAAPVPPPTAPPPGLAVARPLPVATALPPAPAGDTLRDRLAALTAAMLKVPVLVAVATVPYALLAELPAAAVFRMFTVATALGWAVLAGTAGLPFRAADSWPLRLRLALGGALAGAAAYWLDGWEAPHVAGIGGPRAAGGSVLPPDDYAALLHYAAYFGGVLIVARWWRAVARDRRERFSLFPLITAGAWGGLLVFLWPWAAGSPVAGGLVPLLLALTAAQFAAPWAPPAPVTVAKRVRLSQPAAVAAR